jgi:glycosyltransferase involved in cell wall biosynthesis
MAERNLRILVIANLPPHVLGGAENQVAQLVEAWIKAGHAVEVAGHRIPDGVQPLRTVEVRTHRIRTFATFGRAVRAATYALSLSHLAWSMRKRIDVVYCRGVGDGALTLVLLKTLRVLSWPIVACPINARGRGDAHFIRTVPGWRIWAPLVDRHCDALNLIASAIADDLKALGVRRPHISRIPNGIALHPAPRRGQVAAVRRLSWTGRLSAQKGLDLLLRALAAMAARGHRFRLDLVGEGPDRPALTAQARTLGLEGHVHFHGVLDANRVRAQLLDADAFVLPSRYEGMSNSALEAMEAALPVLCTACGGIDEYVADGAGWVCMPNSVQALEEALAAMFDTPDERLLAMGQRARELVESRFTLESVASRNLALLQSVATGNHRA